MSTGSLLYHISRATTPEVGGHPMVLPAASVLKYQYNREHRRAAHTWQHYTLANTAIDAQQNFWHVLLRP
jgi:hypothetical protein